MPLMPQDLVHKAETAMGGTIARIVLAAIAVIALAVAYEMKQARNFSSQEAMDSAQLARNISEGRGFTTQFIRPFSMFLIQRANRERIDSLSKEERADLCHVRGPHPDIANAPVYPVLLAGWMKIMPFRYELNAKQAESRYQPDFLITLLNQLLFVGSALLVFFLARKLFDSTVSWISMALMFGAEILWRFSASGQSTTLLLFLFLLLIWAMLRFETVAADANATLARVLAGAFLVGALLGIGMLTRYSYGVLVFPVIAYLMLFAGRWRMPAVAVVLLAFALVVTPWVVRNLAICGMPFGTASYAAIENTTLFSQHRLERSLSPDLARLSLMRVWWKFFANLHAIISSELPKLGGGLAFCFFVTGLMVSFRNTVLKRLRFFTLAALLALIAMQAIVRTALSDDSPDINSENLIVLVLPLVVIFGVSLFLTLLEQLSLPEGMLVPLVWVRRVVISLFVVLLTLPLATSFLPGRSSAYTFNAPVAFPPYSPPDIQRISGWMNTNEMIMSDVPWAVAWYGDRQSVWMTLDAQRQFYELNDYVKGVKGLYLTPVSLNARMQTDWARTSAEWSWADLIIRSYRAEELPPGFPLPKSPRMRDSLFQQLFLTDWERWLKPEEQPQKK